MMEEINIDRAIDLLSSERPRQRSDGLAGTVLPTITWNLSWRLTKYTDLKHILQQNKNSWKLYESEFLLIRREMLIDSALVGRR